MPDSVLENARLGLMHLLEVTDRKKKYWEQRDNGEMRLSHHPFGLDMKTPDSKDLGDPDSILIADPGFTEGSVQAMLTMLHDVLCTYEQTHKFRLRIIRAEIAEDWNHPGTGKYVHDIYFELITNVASFICGGCSDCSGEGNRGRQRLESIFGFIGLIHDLPVEEVVIPIDKATQGINFLTEAYASFAHDRAA